MLGKTGARASKIFRALKKVDAAKRPGVEQELAILFSDIVGSTGYFERHGDSAGLRMVRRHHELFKPIVQAHGGRVVKTIGDGLMAVFKSARGAVDASYEMQRCLRTANTRLARRERIRVRIGVHHGPVLVDSTGDVFGDVVNVAARIQAKAGPEQILVGEPIQRELTDTYPLRSVGNFQLKGKTSRIELFEVPWKPPGSRTPLFRRWGILAGCVVAGCLAVSGGRYWAHQTDAKRPKLRPEPAPQGRLTLVTTPEAEVWFRHRHLGHTPVANLELPAGVERLILVGPSRKPRVLTVTVEPARSLTLKLKLRDVPLARAHGG